MAGRVVSRTLKPFTVEHWRAYSERVILDTDDYWELEPFHIEVIRPILAGVTEVWAVLPEGRWVMLHPKRSGIDKNLPSHFGLGSWSLTPSMVTRVSKPASGPSSSRSVP